MDTRPYYESDRGLAEYLLFHYGTPEQILPWHFGPQGALNYPVRCVSECVEPQRITPQARGLDLGCAVGRSTFELSRHCREVLGIDYSLRFIGAAQELQRRGALAYTYADEGELRVPAIAAVPVELDRSRV